MSLQGDQDVQDKQPDAVSAHMQVKKWRTLPALLKPPEVGMQTSGYVHDDTSGPNLGPTVKTQLFFLGDICMVTRLQTSQQCLTCGSLAKTSKLIKRKLLRRECMFVHQNQRFFFSDNVDDIKMAGKKQNLFPMWKKMKLVDLGEPTSFLDNVHLGCTQRGCKSNGGITNLCWSSSKHSWLGKIARGYSRLVL